MRKLTVEISETLCQDLPTSYHPKIKEVIYDPETKSIQNYKWKSVYYIGDNIILGKLDLNFMEFYSIVSLANSRFYILYPCLDEIFTKMISNADKLINAFLKDDKLEFAKILNMPYCLYTAYLYNLCAASLNYATICDICKNKHKCNECEDFSEFLLDFKGITKLIPVFIETVAKYSKIYSERILEGIEDALMHISESNSKIIVKK